MTSKYSYQLFVGLNMFQNKFCSIKKLAKRASFKRRYPLINTSGWKVYAKEERLLRYDHHDDVEVVADQRCCSSAATPRGFLAIYVGEERRRFVVPTSSLSHPLFKILLAKTSEEFGYEQKNGLVVPCSVEAFQEVVKVMKCCRGMFDLQHLIQEFII